MPTPPLDEVWRQVQGLLGRTSKLEGFVGSPTTDLDALVISLGTFGQTPPWNVSRSVLAYKYSTTTSTGSITGSAVDLTGTDSMTVTFTAVANRYYMVTYGALASTTVADDRGALLLRNGSTQLDADVRNFRLTATGYQYKGVYIATFSAGSTTLKLSGQRLSGTGTLTFTAASGFPAYLTVTDIGPSAAP